MRKRVNVVDRLAQIKKAAYGRRHTKNIIVRDLDSWVEPVEMVLERVVEEAKRKGEPLDKQCLVSRVLADSEELAGRLSIHHIEKVLRIIKRRRKVRVPHVATHGPYSDREKGKIIAFYHSFKGRRGASIATIRKFGVRDETLLKWLREERKKKEGSAG